jgi:small subunit ribosomal protein S2
MTMPNYTMKELLEAGIHFGHQLNRWNPKMEPYLFGERNGIHIIDLQQTFPLIHSALKVIRDIAAGGGRILFVGTKRQAQKLIAESAINSGQYYMNHRWLGGTLTNWKTISKSIVRLKSYDEILNKEDSGLTKKELVGIQRQRNKLEDSLGGIKDMGGLPDAIFVIDTNKEHIAIKEANVLKIPVIAVIDSNSNPDGVDFPIPGNDDATRAIAMYCKLVSESVLDGLQASFSNSGKDLGKSNNLKEDLPAEDKNSEVNKPKNDNNIKIDDENSEKKLTKKTAKSSESLEKIDNEAEIKDKNNDVELKDKNDKTPKSTEAETKKK